MGQSTFNEIGGHFVEVPRAARVGFGARVGDVACQTGADEPDIAALLAGEAVGGEAGEDPGVGGGASHHGGVEPGEARDALEVSRFCLSAARVAEDQDLRAGL